RRRDDLLQRLVPRSPIPREEELHRPGVREFRRPAKAAVPWVELGLQGFLDREEEALVERFPRDHGEALRERAVERVRVLHRLRALLLVVVRDRGQDRRERRPTVRLLWREVGAAVEHLALR